MIGVIDSWGEHTPPPGAANDDDLLAATGADGVIVLGDHAGYIRAEAMGIDVIAHIGVRPGPPARVRRRLRQQLSRDADVSPMSIWTSGVIGNPLASTAPHADLAIARPQSDLGPFILPIASDPRDVDACRLVLAAALLETAGEPCLIGLPSGISSFHRARNLLSNSDRVIPVEALAHPSPMYIRSADLILDVGIMPSGVIDTACHESGTSRVDARDTRSPMSIAIALRRAMRAGTKA